MVEENEKSYVGEGLRGPIWAAFGVAAAAGAKYVLGDGLFGGRPPAGDPPWARDMNYERELTKANAEIGQLKAEKYADVVTLAAERRLADKIEAIKKAMNTATATQAVLNAKQQGFIDMLAGQVASFERMTARYIIQPVMATSEAALNYKPASVATVAAGTGS